jgi:hypothetical protein
MRVRDRIVVKPALAMLVLCVVGTAATATGTPSFVGVAVQDEDAGAWAKSASDALADELVKRGVRDARGGDDSDDMPMGVRDAGPSDADLKEARNRFLRGEFEDAARKAQRLTEAFEKTEPANPRADWQRWFDAHMVWAMAKWRLNDKDEAERIAMRALTVRPQAPVDESLVPPKQMRVIESMRTKLQSTKVELTPTGAVLVDGLPADEPIRVTSGEHWVAAEGDTSTITLIDCRKNCEAGGGGQPRATELLARVAKKQLPTTREAGAHVVVGVAFRDDDGNALALVELKKGRVARAVATRSLKKLPALAKALMSSGRDGWLEDDEKAAAPRETLFTGAATDGGTTRRLDDPIDEEEGSSIVPWVVGGVVVGVVVLAGGGVLTWYLLSNDTPTTTKLRVDSSKLVVP